MLFRSQDVFMLCAERVEAVQDNELDVVVGFLDTELNEFCSSCFDCDWIVRK